MIQGAMFDMAGSPDLKGSWKNYRTGEVITIRDTLFEDNQLIGVANNGQMIPYTKLQNFVKCDPSETKDKSVLPKNPQGNKKATPKKFVDNINSDTYTGGFAEADPLRTPLKPKADVKQASIRDVDPEAEIPLTSPIKKTDPAIIKVLDGLTEKQKPKITINIKWDEVPEGIMFLQKYLGISTGDIVEECCHKFVNIEDVMSTLNTKLTTIITNALTPPKKGKEE